MSQGPHEILDSTDPGDDVALRFNYQHCYAAIYAIRMLQIEPDVIEVICENHEDLLVRKNPSDFVGVQVKTRVLTQPPFRAKDNALISALARFVRLEARFPGSFSAFEFITNHDFWQEEDNEHNAPFLLQSLKARGGVKGLQHTHVLRMWVQRIAAEAGADEALVVRVLMKCLLKARNEPITSIKRDVVDALAECPGLGHTPIDSLRKMASALVGLACDASTKSLGTSTLALYEPGKDLAAALVTQQLEAKRLRKSQLEETIAIAGHAPAIEALSTSSDLALADLPKSLPVLYQKLERGRLEAVRVVQLENLVHSVEALYFRWAARHGAKRANEQIADLMAIVQFDCTEAKVEASQAGDPFASIMYEALYNRLVERCSKSDEQVYHCRPEHLMGAAGVLTEECKVWWSEPFDLLPSSSS